MTHTHYIATPVSEPPKEKLTEVFCVLKSGARLTCDYIPQVNQWYDSESGQQIEPTHYLKPCTETGAVDEGKFAEWTHKEGYQYHDGLWTHKSENFPNDNGREMYTTSELLEIFKAESKPLSK